MLPRRTLAIAVASYLGVLGSQVMLTVRAYGRFTYALDDAYIHLAIARNLGRSGVFGVEPGVHASASSSPIWSALLALFAPLGDTWLARAPLLLNVLAGLIVLVLVDDEIHRGLSGASERVRIAMAVVLPLLLGLPSLAMMGMEATAFLAVGIALVRATADLSQRRALWLAALATALRPEGALLVFLVVALGVASRRPGALRLALAGLVPIVAFGIYNRFHGDAFVPNSMLMHGLRPRVPGEGTLTWLQHTVMRRLAHTTILPYDAALITMALATVALASAGVATGSSTAEARRRALLFFAACALHQALFSTLAPLGRYQSYLWGLGVLVILAHGEILQSLSAPTAILVAGLALFGAFPHLRVQLLVHRASRDIDMQQRQLAAFVRFAFPNDAVVANDIGAIAFERPGPLIDVCGLGSSVVRRATSAGVFDAQELERLAHGANAKVAMLYPHWVPSDSPGVCGQRPLSWAPVAELRLVQKPMAAAGSVVVIHAIGGGEDALRERLRAFSAQLPRDAVLVELPTR